MGGYSPPIREEISKERMGKKEEDAQKKMKQKSRTSQKEKGGKQLQRER